VEDVVNQGLQFSEGLAYDGIEVVETYLGNGMDTISIKNTSEAAYLLDLGSGDDSVDVEDVSGPFIIKGGLGADFVRVASNESRLNKIAALLVFDGGSDDDESDSLLLDDSGDPNTDDVVNVTRFLVEVSSMQMSQNTLAPKDSYLINLRGATGGEFGLILNDTVTVNISYPYNSSNIFEAVQNALFHDSNSCGQQNTTKCSDALKVYELSDDAFVVIFIGEGKKSKNRDELNH